jgi:pyocin large subunit-like protein
MVLCLRAFNAAMLLLCVLAVVGNGGSGSSGSGSRFRGSVMAAELLLYAVVTADAYVLELNYTVPALHVAVAAIGCAMHAMEPGIFTNDKNAAKTIKKN